MQETQPTTPTPAATDVVVVKKVKIKALRDIAVPSLDNAIILKDQVVEVTEAEAKEYCDRKFDAYSPFYGTKPEIGPLAESGADPLARRVITRAVRVA